MSDAGRTSLDVVAHELKSPIAALVALVEAAEALSGADDRRRLVALAIAAARDVERILTDPELVSLRLELVDVGSLARAFGTDTVRVHVENTPVVTADPTRLRQALWNLVANGLRHGSRVSLEVTERDGRVVLDVVDDGPGVEPGFDPFARGTTSVGSSGLGLWLAHAIAEAHGGTLELVPGGAGARFRLALPRASGAR